MSRPTLCSYSTLSQAQPQTIGFKPPPPPLGLPSEHVTLSWTAFYGLHCVSRCQENITYGHRRRSRGGRGGRGGIVPPSIFESLKISISYILHFKHNESNTKRLIQHKNTTKHTKSLNLPRASRADSRPNHISASLALPAISVAGGGGGAGRQSPPPPNNAFSEFCRYIWKFVATCKPTSMSFVPTKYLKYQQNMERNSSFRM